MLRRLCVLPLLASLLVLTAGTGAGAVPPAEPARPAPPPVESPTKDLERAVGETFVRIAALEAHRLWNEEVARQAAERAAARRPPVTPRRAAAAPSSGGDRHYLCPQYASSDNPTGDFAIPCSYVGRESHGSYTADNPDSSAYGAYQILRLPPGTPPAEQDRIARGMALCNWQPPNYCAGN